MSQTFHHPSAVAVEVVFPVIVSYDIFLVPRRAPDETRAVSSLKLYDLACPRASWWSERTCRRRKSTQAW